MHRHGWRSTLKRGLGALCAAAVAIGATTAPASAQDALTPDFPASLPASHGLGLEPAPPRPGASALSGASVTDLPASVDLTPWALPAGDQGQVNSCAAWAGGYTALGYYLKRQGISGDKLAPMYTYSQLVHGQNVGTMIDDHLSIARTQGVDNQADYTWGNYDYVHTPTAGQKTNAAHWVISGYQGLAIAMNASATTTQNSLKAALADGKPVVIGIPVWSNFYSVTSANHGYYGGISGTFQGYHAITALGYSSTGLRIENSWGPYWGESGFATLSWAFVNQYVNQATAVGELISSNATPTVLASPNVSGALTRGSLLTASGGRFTASPTGYAYQWQRDTGAGFGDISGATGATLVTTGDDVGAKLRVVVTASNATGSVQAASPAFGPITPAAPAVTTAPAISGTTARGQALTVSTGAWTDSPASYTYQWQRATTTTYASITGATAAGYTLQLADVNMNLRVVVTAKNAIGSGTTYSNVAGPIAKAPPTNSAAPTVAGTAARGSVLTSAVGTWAGAGNTYGYAWQRDTGAGFVSITGATGASYTLQGADEGAKIRVKVTATNVDGSLVAYSDATDAVAKAPPVNSSVPTPAGTVARSGVITSNAGSWAGAGNTYAFQWQRDLGAGFVSISGATTATYTLQTADENANVRLRVTATNLDATAVAYSEAVGPVAKTPPVNTVAPVVTGTAARASVLTATGGTWSASGNTYAFQWQKDSGSGFADIAGANKNTYTLAKADEGASLRIRVTATNVDGIVAASSAATGPVADAPPLNTAVPVITGSAVRTSKLTATGGTWSGVGNTYAYQWQRDPDGEGFVDIAGATATTYTPVVDDEGANLRVKVTATNPDAAVAAYSAATAAVAKALPVQATAPAASGTARTTMTVTTTAGVWTPAGSTYAYQWQRDGGSGFADISGATSATYVLTDDDAGAKVRAKVTAINVDGSTAGYSGAIGPILATPTASAAPEVTGPLMDANILTAASGIWHSAGDLAHTYTYEWIRCPAAATVATATGCKSITAASASPSYTTVAADVGARLAVRATATNTQKVANAALSAVTEVLTGRPLTNSVLPKLTGTTMVHESLRVDNGTWSVPLTAIAYQWRRCETDGTTCADIAGAKAATYTPVVADTGKRLVARVNVASPGRTAAADSEATAAIDPLPLPSPSSAMTVRGSAARLQTLTLVSPAWNAYPTTAAYAWLRCDAAGDNCAAIAGANKTTYVATKADEGSTLRARMDATNTTGTGSSTTGATAVVAAAAPVATGAPVVTGAAVAGATLTMTRGGWSATTDTAYSYSWQRCEADGSSCAAIAGAIATTYRLVAADVDKTLKAVVTATNPDAAVPSSSAATAKVKPAPPAATVLPVLSGTAQVGKTLTLTLGTWTGATGTPAPAFYRCGATCVRLSGTANTYTLTAADAGYSIRGTVTASGPGGSTEGKAAAVLGPVKAATAGSALLATGTASLRSSTGSVLAKASVAATGVTVKPAGKLKGTWQVWACPTSGTDWQPCTAPVKLTAKGARLKVGLDAGEKVRVVVARRR
jgi:hypothetical protein